MGKCGVVYSDDESVDRALIARRREKSFDLVVGQCDQFLFRPGRGFMRPTDNQGQMLAGTAFTYWFSVLADRVFNEDPFDGRIEQTDEFQVGDRFVIP